MKVWTPRLFAGAAELRCGARAYAKDMRVRPVPPYLVGYPVLGAPSLRALLIPAQKYMSLQLGRAAFTRAFSASVLQKVVRCSPGTTQVLTFDLVIEETESLERLKLADQVWQHCRQRCQRGRT